MSEKVIVLGSSGMLGSMIVDILSRDPALRITATVRTEAMVTQWREQFHNVNWNVFDADATNLQDALRVIEGHSWVINAIGITKPLIHDDNSFEIERAIRINALLPHVVTERTEKSGARLLQIATDCVFSGNRGKYQEDDLHDALDVYGKSKSLGEVHAHHAHHLRCSIIGPEPKDHKFLLDWFLRQSSNVNVSGYKNHSWNGITTLHFAKLCHGVITNNISLPHLQHVLPSGDVSKYELLRCFAKEYHREDVIITPTDAALAVDRTLMTKNKVLNQELWAAAGYSQPPTVSEMIAELAAFNYRFVKH